MCRWAAEPVSWILHLEYVRKKVKTTLFKSQDVQMSVTSDRRTDDGQTDTIRTSISLIQPVPREHNSPSGKNISDKMCCMGTRNWTKRGHELPPGSPWKCSWVSLNDCCSINSNELWYFEITHFSKIAAFERISVFFTPSGKGGNGKDGNGFGPGRKDGNGGNGFLTPQKIRHHSGGYM